MSERALGQQRQAQIDQSRSSSSSSSSAVNQSRLSQNGRKGSMNAFIDCSGDRTAQKSLPSSSRNRLDTALPSPSSTSFPSQKRPLSSPSKNRIPFSKPNFAQIPPVTQMGAEQSQSNHTAPSKHRSKGIPGLLTEQQNGARNRSSSSMEISSDMPPPQRISRSSLINGNSEDEHGEDQMQVDGDDHHRSTSIFSSTSNVKEDSSGKLIKHFEFLTSELILLTGHREKYKTLKANIRFGNLDQTLKDRFEECRMEKENLEQVVADRKSLMNEQLNTLLDEKSNSKIEAISLKVAELQKEIMELVQQAQTAAAPPTPPVENVTALNVTPPPNPPPMNRTEEPRVKVEGSDNVGSSHQNAPQNHQLSSISVGTARQELQRHYVDSATSTDGIPLTELISHITRQVKEESIATYQNVMRVMMQQNLDKDAQIQRLQEQVNELSLKSTKLHGAYDRSQGIFREHREILENHVEALKRHEVFIQGTTALFEQIPRVKGDYGPPLPIGQATPQSNNVSSSSSSVPQTSAQVTARQTQPLQLVSSTPTVPSSTPTVPRLP